MGGEGRVVATENYMTLTSVDALRALCLQPQGGANGRTVVVEGQARHILKSLSLPGVRHASLDRSIALARPHH